MKLKQFRQLIGYSVVALTILFFAKFIDNNPEVIEQLKQTSIITIAKILLLYAAMTGLLAVLYKVMTDICNTKVPAKENLLLTMYSSVVNFFGPLQSGPGFRTVYLKKKHNINVAKYIGVSLLYYTFFGVISGLMLLSGLFGYSILGLFVVIAVLLYIGLPWLLKLRVLKRFIPSNAQSAAKVTLKPFAIMAALSLAQVLLVAVIYHVQLTSIQPSIGFDQTIIYTGAANFALFVSLTPGALGFRESFLFFSQDLHHIDQATIVSANIIDRGVYLVFLGILFAIIVLFHGQQKFAKVRASK